MTDNNTPTTASLIEQGYLVPPRLYVRPAVLEHELHARSIVMGYQSICQGKRVIVFVNTVKYAEFLAEQFVAARIPARTILASHNDAQRRAALADFTDGDCLVLITINVDLSPAKADGVIIATPHGSAHKYEHQILSAMRPRYADNMWHGTDAQRRDAITRSDKPVAMVLDMCDNHLRHPSVIARVANPVPKSYAHLTIPGSLEWDQAPEAAAPDTTDAQPYPVAEYEPGQWWLAEIEKCGRTREVTHDTVRACGIVGNFAAAAFAELAVLRKQLNLLNPARIDSCKECGSKSLSWFTTNTTGTSGIQNGRLRTEDVTCQFVLGCDDCSETLRVVNADTIAARLNADTQHAKDTAQ